MEAEMKEPTTLRVVSLRLVSPDSEVEQLATALWNVICSHEAGRDSGVIIDACFSILASVVDACPAEALLRMQKDVLNAMSMVFDHIEGKRQREMN
jgi:hypothetical protein